MSAEFTKLWIGYSISTIGSQITVLALPLTAVLLLGGGPTETGLLVAARTAPIALVGPFVGVWVDRRARRPILVGTSLASAVVVATVPAAALLGRLTMPQLYAVALLGGSLMTAALAARSAIVPALVGRSRLVTANARLQASDSIAQVAGPSFGGVLVQALTAPIAMAADALTFLASALFTTAIRIDERPSASHEALRLWHEIAEGLSFVRDQSVLVRAIVAIALANVEWFAVQAVIVVYGSDELRLSPAILGIALAVAGPFSVLSAASASAVIARLGLGPTMIVGLALEAASRLILPFASGDAIAAAALLGLTQALVGVTVPLWSVSFRTVQQAVTPDRLLGRVWSAASALQWVVAPPAALGAGLVADRIGMRPMLFITGLIAVAATLYLLFSPVRVFREVHDPPSA